MTVDLWMLASSVALTWGLIMFAATPPLPASLVLIPRVADTANDTFALGAQSFLG